MANIEQIIVETINEHFTTTNGRKAVLVCKAADYEEQDLICTYYICRDIKSGNEFYLSHEPLTDETLEAMEKYSLL